VAGSSDVRVSASSKSIQKRPSAPWGSCCCPSRRLPLGGYPPQKIENSAAAGGGRRIFNLLRGPRPRPPDGKTQNRALFPTRRVPPSQSPPFRRYARSRFAKPQRLPRYSTECSRKLRQVYTPLLPGVATLQLSLGRIAEAGQCCGRGGGGGCAPQSNVNVESAFHSIAKTIKGRLDESEGGASRVSAHPPTSLKEFSGGSVAVRDR